MRRDMELVRKILFAVESQPTDQPKALTIDGYSREEVGYHVAILIEAGLVNGQETTPYGGTLDATPFRLTWKGHEFIDAAREPAVWFDANTMIQKVGSASFEIWRQVLSTIVSNHIGLSL